MYTILRFPQKVLKHNYILQKNNKFKNFASCTTEVQASSLAPGYQPQQVEANALKLNNADVNKYVKQKNSNSYRMILPPPNVTGDLHLGHALMAIIQDVLCRYHRSLNYDVEWIPGTDHAGIATQVIVEKQIFKELGLTRHEIGKEKFLERIWKWKNEKECSILLDLKKLGCTLDWNKEYFTMDERQAHAVNVAFVKLFDEGLITRKNSLVNWSCALESAVSDIEVETLEVKGPTQIHVPGHQNNVTFGNIYDISYRLLDSDEEIIVSTTRPETMLGDVAVAVHPQDPRYIKYRNMDNIKLWHPFRKEPIPLIFDVMVDQEFGTGALKITPAHDRDDFVLAERHLLNSIPVFTEKGLITEAFDFVKYLPRFEARTKIINMLTEMKLLHAIKPHTMNLPICSRSKDVIEYMLCPQWYLHCQPLADAAMAEVRSGRLQIIPPNFELEWHRWLENCHDWCISRQLWWGHQIPAYEAKDAAGNSCWVAAMSLEEATTKAETILKSSIVSIKRDEDVLDTWFSSSLLPFSIYNWPSADYKQSYPLDIMETGHDILFFWVARMVMLGLKLTDEIPFKKVLLHGIVCDAHGRKMSKSLGNIITPQQVVQGATLESLAEEIHKSHANGIFTKEEYDKSLKGLEKLFPNGIKECGTDALRFTLCSHNIKNHFINFDISECYANKLFLNKIWQATRFTLGTAEKLKFPLSEISNMHALRLNKWDKWILSRLAGTLQIYEEAFKTHNLHNATAALKHFFYNNFCDVYLETTKDDINKIELAGYMHCATLTACLIWGLRAMQPFTPFVAQELLNSLPTDIVMHTNKFYNVVLEKEISNVLEICQQVRQLKSRNQITKKYEPQLYLYAHNADVYKMLQTHLNQIKALTMTVAVNLELLSNAIDVNAFDFYSTGAHLCLFGLNVNESYKKKQDKREVGININQQKLEKLTNELSRYQARVNNEGFLKSASQNVQKKHFEKIKQLEVEIQNIQNLRN